MVRPGGVRAESDDCLEAVFRSELFHLKIEHSGQLTLAHALSDIRQSSRQGFRRYRCGGFNGCDFSAVFDAADIFNYILRRLQPGFQGLFQLLVLGNRRGFFNGNCRYGFFLSYDFRHGFG